MVSLFTEITQSEAFGRGMNTFLGESWVPGRYGVFGRVPTTGDLRGTGVRVL